MRAFFLGLLLVLPLQASVGPVADSCASRVLAVSRQRMDALSRMMNRILENESLSQDTREALVGASQADDRPGDWKAGLRRVLSAEVPELVAFEAKTIARLFELAARAPIQIFVSVDDRPHRFMLHDGGVQIVISRRHPECIRTFTRQMEAWSGLYHYYIPQHGNQTHAVRLAALRSHTPSGLLAGAVFQANADIQGPIQVDGLDSTAQLFLQPLIKTLALFHKLGKEGLPVSPHGTGREHSEMQRELLRFQKVVLSEMFSYIFDFERTLRLQTHGVLHSYADYRLERDAFVARLESTLATLPAEQASFIRAMVQQEYRERVTDRAKDVPSRVLSVRGTKLGHAVLQGSDIVQLAESREPGKGWARLEWQGAVDGSAREVAFVSRPAPALQAFQASLGSSFDVLGFNPIKNEALLTTPRRDVLVLDLNTGSQDQIYYSKREQARRVFHSPDLQRFIIWNSIFGPAPLDQDEVVVLTRRTKLLGATTDNENIAGIGLLGSRFIAMAGVDGSLQMFEFLGPLHVRQTVDADMGHEFEGPIGTAISPDGRYISIVHGAEGNRSLLVYDTELETRFDHSAASGWTYGEALQWSSDGESVALISTDRNSGEKAVHLRNATTGATRILHFPLGIPREIDAAISFSKDGSRLVVSQSSAVMVWDL